MSKLAKAPLVEVIFEIKWTGLSESEIREIQNLHGDLFAALKGAYQYRETVQSLPSNVIIHLPTHRFRAVPNGYPLVQVGPALVTVNTIEKEYTWPEFETRVIDVVKKLNEVYKFRQHHNVSLVFQYIDMLKFDFNQGKISEYLKDYLHISAEQSFYPSAPKFMSLAYSFDTNCGSLNVSIGKGTDAIGGEGIAIHTNLTSGHINPDGNSIGAWLAEAHEICSNCFKQMTRGTLYESFK